MEYLDIYDINRMRTGKTFVRGEKPENGYYLVVQAIIFNTQGQMLIQQRQSDKLGWPNKWDVSAGGSVQAGENSQQAAGRELQEELGIAIDFSGIRPHISSTFMEGFTDVYLVEKDIDVTDLTLQKDEVQDARWASREEILDMIAKGEFVPYYPSWICYLFDCRKTYGSFRRDNNLV
ncbi:MAG: NUDIX domain-containing protein [Clostridia bacterium]|nr:NUDIX domain-containing protein [Clostridia bacterium]